MDLFSTSSVDRFELKIQGLRSAQTGISSSQKRKLTGCTSTFLYLELGNVLTKYYMSCEERPTKNH